jgi:hypothetical protein
MAEIMIISVAKVVRTALIGSARGADEQVALRPSFGPGRGPADVMEQRGSVGYRLPISRGRIATIISHSRGDCPRHLATQTATTQVSGVQTDGPSQPRPFATPAHPRTVRALAHALGISPSELRRSPI